MKWPRVFLQHQFKYIKGSYYFHFIDEETEGITKQGDPTFIEHG